MIKIEFDRFSTCCVGSEFTLNLQVLPRVGEEVVMDRGMFPAVYDGDLSSYDDEEDAIGIKVVGIYHRVSKGGHVIRLDFDFVT